MKLYHGTSSKSLPSILQEGIQPRSQTLKDSNFSECPSHDDYVYLTKVYSLYFGYIACQENDQICLLEVDLDLLNKDCLCPDEDFIGFALAQQEKSNLTETTLTVEPFLYQPYWEESLNNLGNCCYHGQIPKEAITRYALIEPSQNSELVSMGLEPTISILNYQFCGDIYQNLTEHIFDGVPLQSKVEISCPHNLDKQTKLLLQKRKQHLEKLSQNRDILVVTLA